MKKTLAALALTVIALAAYLLPAACVPNLFNSTRWETLALYIDLCS